MTTVLSWFPVYLRRRKQRPFRNATPGGDAAARPRAVLRLERVEDRTMPAGVTAWLSAAGVLTVTGTAGNDVISVRQDDGLISVLDTPVRAGADSVSQVAAGRVKGIVVQGLGGDDTIRLDQGGQPITAPATIDTGTGRDFVAGGAGNDTITAGSTQDTVWGGGGTDAVTGAAVPAAAAAAVRDGLNALAQWAGHQSLPLLGPAGLRQAVQAGLVDPLSTYLAAGLPTDDGFLQALKTLGTQAGGLAVTVDPAGVQRVVSGATTTYSLDFRASLTAATPVHDLGDEAARLGVRLDPGAAVAATTTVHVPLSFSITAGPTPAFALALPTTGLTADLTADATDLTVAASVGFLGARVQHGSVHLVAHAALSAADADNSGTLSLAEVRAGSLVLTAGGAVSATLPVVVNLDTFSVPASFPTQSTITVTSADPSATPPRVSGVDGWLDFTTVSAPVVGGALDQVGGQLGQLGAAVWPAGVPFTTALSVGQAADLQGVWKAAVTDGLGAWNAVLNQKILTFSTAQELAAGLARALGVDPARVAPAYNPTTHLLTYRVTIDRTATPAPTALAVDLNRGGLADAQIGAVTLGLTARVTADLSFGVKLTALGDGFTLATTTPLAALNGGAQLQTTGSAAPDLLISLTDGTSFGVDLDGLGGAATVQNVMDRIRNASGGNVELKLDPQGRAALVVHQTPSQDGLGDGDPFFTVVDATDAEGDAVSNAAEFLGIGGRDGGRTGDITGLPVHGDAWDKHVFVRDASVGAIVTGTAGGVTAAANLGAVGLTMTNGSAAVRAAGSITLGDPGTGAADGRITLHELGDALRAKAGPGAAVAASSFSGSAHLCLPVALKAALPGVSLPANAKVVVDWPDVTNAAGPSVTVNPPLPVQNLTLGPVVDALGQAGGFLSKVLDTGTFQQPLPGLGQSLSSLIDPGAVLGAALDDLRRNAPATVDALAARLTALLGGDEKVKVTVSFSDNVFQIGLSYGLQKTVAVPLGFDLSGFGRFGDLSAAAPVTVTLDGTVRLDLAVDLSQPTAPQVYLADTSGLTLHALVGAAGINLTAAVGPLGVFVRNGTMRLDSGTAGRPATFAVGLAPQPAPHLWPIADAAANLAPPVVTGQAAVVLPVNFPTQGQALDPAAPNVELRVGSLADPGGTTSLVQPNFQQAINSLGAGAVYDALGGGWDGLTQLLRGSLLKSLVGQHVPLVGDQLAHALDFLQQMDDRVVGLLDTAERLTPQVMEQALFAAFGPAGLNWLQDANNDHQVTVVDVGMQTSADGAHFHPKLQVSHSVLSTPLDVRLGLDGLGLKVDGNLQFFSDFDLDLGFGVSRQAGFYLDPTDTVGVTFTAQLPASATGSLAFLRLQVTPAAGTTPNAHGGFSLALTDPNHDGRVSLAELAAAVPSFSASADVNLTITAGVGDDPDLPRLKTAFHFQWSTSATVPTTVSFDSVSLDLGGLVDRVAAQIGQVLKPIQPVADLLSAELPVLSQLAGHKVTLLDLARTLGVVSDGTGDFVEAVVDFVHGMKMGVPEVVLGGFTLDPKAAADPAELGRLAPATITASTPWNGQAIKGFDIPVLEHPTDAFKLLLGQDIPLVTYTMPTLGLDFSFSHFFPIIGPLGAELEGEIGANAEFTFGYDTSGFRAFAAGGFHDPGLILNGFFVDDRSRVELYGGISAFAAIDLSILKAGIGGGIEATVDFRLHDPNNDGRVNLPELAADLAAGHIFDAHGYLEAYLAAFVEIDLYLFHKRWDFEIARVQLAEIGETPTPVAQQTPVLATVQGGVLRLNVGPYAASRVYGDIADGGETMTVTQAADGTLTVAGFGRTQQFGGPGSGVTITKVVADGGAGNDTITVDVHSDVAVDLSGGTEDDTLTVKGGGAVTLSGGAGNDTLRTEAVASAALNGDDDLDTLTVTGTGPATLHGGAGPDTLYGGPGEKQQLYGDTDNDTLWAGSGPAQTLSGGDGDDILVGGTGAAQALGGDGGADSLYGGTGGGQVLHGGPGTDTLAAWAAATPAEAAGQVLYGDAGNDTLQVGWSLVAGLPQPTAPSDASTAGAGHGYELHGGSGADVLSGGAGPDTLYGEAGNDQLYGGRGTDSLFGGFGDDELHGGPDADTLSGGIGDDLELGDAGDDKLYGDAGSNTLWGDFGTLDDPSNGVSGNDTFYAGIGQDAMYGEAGEDTFLFALANVSGVNADVIDGGPNRDAVVFTGGDANDDITVKKTENLALQPAAAAAGGSLSVGQTYYWTVTAVTAAGETGVSQETSLTPTAGSRAAALTWDTFYGATAYKIYRTTLSGVYAGALVATVPAVPAARTGTYTDTGAATSVGTLPRLYDLSDSIIPAWQRDAAGNVFFDQTWRRDAAGHILDQKNAQPLGTIRYQVPASVEIFRIDALGGDDRVRIDPLFPQRMQIDGGTGNDTLVGGGGKNVIWGGIGDDLLVGGNPLPGIEGGNELHGGDGTDTLVGGTGSDALFGEANNDILVGGAGSDFLYGGAGDDLIVGDGQLAYAQLVGSPAAGPAPGLSAGLGATLNGLAAALTFYSFPTATDTATDIIYGDDDASGPTGGNDSLFGGGGDDVIFGGGGNDWVNGGLGLDVVDGGAGNDTLNGGGGYDRVLGGADGDRIYATRWDAVVLTSVIQDPTYDYIDVLRHYNKDITSIQNKQTIILDEVSDLAALDLLLRNAPDPTGKIAEAIAKYPQPNPVTGETTLEQLEDLYGDDDARVQAQQAALLTQYSSNLDRELAVIVLARNTVDDALSHLPAADADWKSTSGPSYVLIGGDGDDTIQGSAGRDVIDGGFGSDKIYWSPGNDAIFGGTDGSGTRDAATDSFVVSGTGQADTIDVWSVPGAAVYVRFKGQATLGTLLAARQDANVQVDHLGIESVEVDALGGNDYVTVATGADAFLTVRVEGGDGDDYLNAGGKDGVRPGDTDPNHLQDPNDPARPLPQAATNVTLVGGAGNDTLWGGAGGQYESPAGVTHQTILDGGADNDILYAGTGSGQALTGGAGNDILYAGTGSAQVLNGGAGDDTVFTGTGASDVLDGGTGDNTLVVKGPGGNDSLQISPGVAKVNGAAGTWTNFAHTQLRGGAGNDTLTVNLAEGTVGGTIPDLTITGGGGTNSLVVQADNAGDTITLGPSLASIDAPYLLPAGAPTDPFPIDGPFTGTAAGVSRVTMLGGTGADVLLADGLSIPVTLDGRGGADTLVGGSADDTFVASGDGSSYYGGGGPANTLVLTAAAGQTAAAYANGYYDTAAGVFHPYHLSNVDYVARGSGATLAHVIDSFASTDWTVTDVSSGRGYHLGTSTSSPADDGPTGHALAVTDTIPPYDYYVPFHGPQFFGVYVGTNHVYQGYVYDPATAAAGTQGFQFGFYAQLSTALGNSQYFGLTPVIEQGGVVFLSGGSASFATSSTPTGQWQYHNSYYSLSGGTTTTLSQSEFTAADGSGRVPDFSSRGAPIRFGFREVFSSRDVTSTQAQSIQWRLGGLSVAAVSAAAPQPLPYSPPVAATGLTISQAGIIPYTVRADAGFTDPNANVSLSTQDLTLYGNISWGDGGGKAMIPTATGANSYSLSATHLYAARGRYTVTAALFDEAGAAAYRTVEFVGGPDVVDGELRFYTSATAFAVLDSGVSSFLVRQADAAIFILHADGTLWLLQAARLQFDPPAPQRIDPGPVQSMWLDGSNILYVRHADGSLSKLPVSTGTPHLVPMGVTVGSSGGGGGATYYTVDIGALLATVASGSSPFGAVRSVAADPDGLSVDVMMPDGGYWRYDGTNQSLIAGPHFVIAAPPAATAGQALGVRVTVFDALGETVPGYTGTVTLAADDAATGPPGHTFTPADNGTFTFTLTLKTAGARTVTAADGTRSTVAGVAVAPAAAAAFRVAGPATAPPGTPVGFTLSAVDAFGNAVPTYTGTARLASSDPAAGFPATAAVANGAGAFTATFYSVGVQSVTAAAGAVAGTAQVSTPGAALAGADLVVAGSGGPDAVAIDSFGAGVVHVSLNGADLGFFTLGPGGTVRVVAGGGDDVVGVRGAAVPVALDGGGGTNTLDLSAAAGPATWAVTGTNAGAVGGVAFANVQRIVGSPYDDTFGFGPAGSLAGTVDGGGGYDTLDYTGSGRAAAVDLAAGAATGLNGGRGGAFTRVQNFVGDRSAGPNRLTPPTAATTYTRAAAGGSLDSGQNFANFALSTVAVTWANPAAVPFGTPLGAAQLNATAANRLTAGAVPGTYTYSPAAGAVVPAGTQTLRVTFTPADPALAAATGTVALVVTPATLSFTGLSAPAITAGAAATVSGRLAANAGGPGVPAGEAVQVTVGGVTLSAALGGDGSFSITLPTQSLGAAGSPYPVHLAYGGDANFRPAAADLTLTVNAAVIPPTGTPAPTRSPLVVGGQPYGAAAVYAPNAGGRYSDAPVAFVNPFGPLGVNVRTAAGDVNGDGTPDLILVTGPGTLMQVAVVDGRDNSTVLVAPFVPFDGFTAGGFAAAGDIRRSGRDQFVISPDRAGGPRVSIYELIPGAGLVRQANYFSLDPDFRGGVRTAVGDLDGDHVPDLVIAAGYGGGPRVSVIDGRRAFSTDGFDPADRLVHDFYAFDPALRDGGYPAVGDVDGDGVGDLILGPGDGGPMQVVVVSGKRLLADGAVAAFDAPLARFTPTGLGPDGSGARVAAVDADGDGRADIAVGPGRFQFGLVKVYPGAIVGGAAEPGGGQLLDPFSDAFLTDGVFVG